MEHREQLLKTANQRYPANTQYSCASGSSTMRYTVKQQTFRVIDDNTVYAEAGKGCLYKHGKWAKIRGENYEIY